MVDEVNDTPILKVDDSIQQMQIQKLNVLRQKRDNTKVEELLTGIKQKAMTSENLMPIVIEAVENYCTLGEISHALRSVWGEHK